MSFFSLYVLWLCATLCAMTNTTPASLRTWSRLPRPHPFKATAHIIITWTNRFNAVTAEPWEIQTWQLSYRISKITHISPSHVDSIDVCMILFWTYPKRWYSLAEWQYFLITCNQTYNLSPVVKSPSQSFEISLSLPECHRAGEFATKFYLKYYPKRQSKRHLQWPLESADIAFDPVWLAISIDWYYFLRIS